MGGYVHFIQTQAPDAVHINATSVWTDGGTLAASGSSGMTEAGEPVVAVCHERPAEFSLPVGKLGAQVLHLEKFRVDSRARGDGDPFLSVRPTEVDPPDFACVDRDGRVVGVECRALADERRRAAYGHLNRLKRRLEMVGASAFQHLRDCAVYVYFEHDGELGMPRPEREATAYDALVAAIRDLPVHRAALWLDDDQQMPEQAPDIGLLSTAFGDRTHAAPVNDDYRPSRFMRRMGFDLILGFTTLYRLSDVESGLNAAMAKKDRPGNDWLLLTAGGPNQQGLTFPGEELVSSLVVEHPPIISAPAELRRVILHRWGSGDAWELYPKYRQLFGRARPDLPTGLAYEVPRPSAELKPGRNQPCPCGSGAVFKRCHGKPVPFLQTRSGLLVPDT